MEKPELTIKQILVSAEVPVRNVPHESLRNQGFDHAIHQKAVFVVNTETWECEGQVSGHPVLADEEWWKDQCKRVSDRVKAKITTLTV